MTLEEAMERVRKLATRRREKSESYADAAAQYEARAISLDEVLSAQQREFLSELGRNAQRSAQTMADDGLALATVLDALVVAAAIERADEE